MNLPAIKADSIFTAQIDKLTRKISSNDVFDTDIFPIYFQNKMSLQCLTPRLLMIDGNGYHSTKSKQDFFPKPTKIVHDGRQIFGHTIDKLDKIDWTYDVNILDQPTQIFSTNLTDLHVIDKIKQYFLQADIIDYGLWTTIGLLTLTLCCVFPACIFIFKPTLLKLCFSFLKY